jgi:hypothetical protein
MGDAAASPKGMKEMSWIFMIGIENVAKRPCPEARQRKVKSIQKERAMAKTITP